MTVHGNLYVISAPSGTGKTTLVKSVVDTLAHVTVSISHTTRAKRQGEMNGINYHFVDEAEFQHLIQSKDFLEYATIFHHHYGTSRRWVMETLAAGKDVILEIDWQGYEQIKKLFPHTIGIFILPPSLHALKERLMKREQNRPEIVAERLKDVNDTLSHLTEYHYIIINDDFQEASKELQIIITAGQLLQERQVERHPKLIAELSRSFD